MHFASRFRFIALIFAAVLWLTSFNAARAEPARNLEHGDSAAVAATVNSFHKALANADSAGAMALLASDAVIMESGDAETRAEYRAHHLSGDIAFTKALPGTRGKLTVTVEGSTAWTVGASTTKGQYKGRQINSVGVETMVLTKTAAGWRIRSIHWSSHAQRAPAGKD